MRRFERGTGDGARFWAVAVAGRRVELTFGKVGTAGRRLRTEFATEQIARADADRRAAEKLAEGYAETTDLPPLRRALEEALVAQPDDLAAHMAYADWLGEQDDSASQVRAEFIRVQLALEDPRLTPAQRHRLIGRERDLLARNCDAWLGPLAPLFGAADEPRSACHFARGWIDAVRLDLLDAPRARLLFAAPQLRLLRRLTLLDDFNAFAAFDVLTRAAYFGNVEVLSLGDIDGEFGFCPFVDATDLVAVLPCFPRLRELNLNVRDLLEDHLFETPAVRGLHTLRLVRVRLYDVGVRRLARSKVLGGIRVLQLWNARITDAGARALARNKAVGKLERLDVSFNYLTPVGIEVLRQTGVPLVAECQMSPLDDHDDEIELDEFELDLE